MQRSQVLMYLLSALCFVLFLVFYVNLEERKKEGAFLSPDPEETEALTLQLKLNPAK